MLNTSYRPLALVLCSEKTNRQIIPEYEQISDALTLEETAHSLRGKFNEYIDHVSRHNTEQIDWWVSSLGCRNTYVNKAFYHLVYLSYCDKMLMRHPEISVVIVDSHGLCNCIKKLNILTKRQCDVLLVGEKQSRSRFTFWTRIFRDCLLFFCRQIMLHIAAKLSACMNGIPHRNGFPPIVLVDTFVFDYSFASGKFRDAYFADMVSLLPHINWWYIPTLFRQSRPLKCFINMRRNEIPFIIPRII